VKTLPVCFLEKFCVSQGRLDREISGTEVSTCINSSPWRVWFEFSRRLDPEATFRTFLASPVAPVGAPLTTVRCRSSHICAQSLAGDAHL
jgi:hypothetical protein